MYHAIVRWKLRRILQAVNRGDYDYVIRQFTPDAEHWFSGEDHALSGGRHSHPLLGDWYRRLGTLFPDFRFEVKKMIVSGPPWKTYAAVEWLDFPTDRMGRPMPNEGVLIATLVWGRATELHIYCDTKKLEKNLGILATQGVPEAVAPPIRDRA